MHKAADTLNRRRKNRRWQTAAVVIACTSLESSAVFAQTVPPLDGNADPAGYSSATGAESIDPLLATEPRAALPTTFSTAAIPASAGDFPQGPEGRVDSLVNQPEQPVEGGGGREIDGRNEAPGIRVGTFVLRPSLTQSLNTEQTRSGGVDDKRHYSRTGLRGTLTSDWSLHQLTVTGEGHWEKNIGGRGATEPDARIDAELRLDLPQETTARITGGYNFSREDSNDPNAISGASTQASVHQYSGGLSLERNLGRLRGSAGLTVERTVYGDAEAADGTNISQKDRNRTGGELRLRAGYELSPALIPFIEVSLGRTSYDRSRDASGYARSSDNYGARTGIEFDLGEKLRGEFGVGYTRSEYEDNRLSDIAALAIDGNATWSPQRGTDVTLGLRTTIEDATVPGESGWVAYELSTGIMHELRYNLVARLSGSVTYRDYDAGGGISSDTTYIAGAGLTWGINRYLDLTSDVEYETRTNSGSDTWRAGVGLTLKR